MTDTDVKLPEPGTVLRVLKDASGHGFEVGTEVTAVERYSDYENDVLATIRDDWEGLNGGAWTLGVTAYLSPEEYEVVSGEEGQADEPEPVESIPVPAIREVLALAGMTMKQRDFLIAAFRGIAHDQLR